MSELCAWSMIFFIFSPESPLCGFFYIYFLISLYNWLLFTWYKTAMKIKINVPSFFLPPFLLQVQSVMFHKDHPNYYKNLFFQFQLICSKFSKWMGKSYIPVHEYSLNSYKYTNISANGIFQCENCNKIIFLLLHQVALKNMSYFVILTSLWVIYWVTSK